MSSPDANSIAASITCTTHHLGFSLCPIHALFSFSFLLGTTRANSFIHSFSSNLLDFLKEEKWDRKEEQ
jgi:hypothetical protein